MHWHKKFNDLCCSRKMKMRNLSWWNFHFFLQLWIYFYSKVCIKVKNITQNLYTCLACHVCWVSLVKIKLHANFAVVLSFKLIDSPQEFSHQVWKEFSFSICLLPTWFVPLNSPLRDCLLSMSVVTEGGTIK